MKTLKKIGIGLLILLVLLTIIGLLLPKDIHVSETRTFNAPTNYVFNIMNDLKNAPLYNDWVMKDPKMKLSYGDITMGNGASYSWDSDMQGKGMITYDKSVSPDSIVAKMIFNESDESKMKYSFTPNGESTNMTWEMHSEMGFPYNLFGWFFKYQMRKAYNNSFDNIEQLLGTRLKGNYSGYQINEELIKEKNYIISRDEVAFTNIQKFYSQNLTAIFQKLQTETVVMDGMPSGLFFKYDETKGVTDMAVGVPVMEAISIAELSTITLPSSQAIVVDYYGPNDATEKAHYAIENYMRDRNLLSNSPIIEEYVTDVLKEKDPAKWLTKIIYYYSKDN